MAQNTLEIIIKANSSKAITEIKKLDTTIGKMSGTSAKGFDALKAKWTALDNKLSSPGGFKVMLGAAGAAVGTLAAVGATVKRLADDFMGYAFQVEDFGRIIGATPEEASKIIQVADDVRLSVEQMTVAMKQAVAKGYEPNIEGLKRMADEYNAIPKKIDRTRFAIEIFGQRAGPQMAKLLELGSAKIEAMGNSIEGTARLMTDEGIASAQAYFNALDNLGDAVQGITLELGAKFTPTITNLAEGLTTAAEDGVNLIDMLSTMQSAMETGTVSISDIVLELAAYMAATKSGADITAELIKKIQEATYNTDNFGNVLPDMNEALRASVGALGGTSDALEEVGTSANKSASDLARMAGEASKIRVIDAKLDFSFPNFADKMKNLIDSVDWQAAGGGALEQFMQGFSADIANKTPDVQKEIAAKVGAVDIALRVETGEITKSEGIQQLMDLAGTDYSKAKGDLETIMKLQPADIGPYLEQIAGIGPAAEEGAKQEDELTQKIEGATTALRLGQSDLSGWNATTGSLAESSQEAAKQVGALNTQLKNMPKVIDVAINIKTSGGGTTPAKTRRRAEGGPVYNNNAYLVGERGPELFVPNMTGRIIPNSQITNNNTDKNIYITNNYTISTTKEINIRELARQVTREQQRTGAT